MDKMRKSFGRMFKITFGVIISIIIVKLFIVILIALGAYELFQKLMSSM